MTVDVRARLEPGLVRLRAGNSSPMTGAGTNSYVLGRDRLCVIDPGPQDDAHLAALLDEIGGRPVEAILVTHAHRDHSALAPNLAEATGGPICGFGPADAGRSPLMRRLAGAGLGGGEGLDAAFRPERILREGERIALGGTPVTALHMPGHMAGHLCFAWRGAVFSGDLVMGWASTLISPPDGDLAEFRLSCTRLRELRPRRLYPGHGAPVNRPDSRIDWLLSHRAEREAQIVGVLSEGPADAGQITQRLYAGIPAELQAAARRNVLAHLLDLMSRNRAIAETPELAVARFKLT